MQKDRKHYMKEYDERWKKHVETNGTLDVDKVAREFSDLVFVTNQYQDVLSVVTKDRISKLMTYSEEVVKVHKKLFEDKSLMLDFLKEELEVIKSKRAEAENPENYTFTVSDKEYLRGYQEALESIVKYVN